MKLITGPFSLYGTKVEVALAEKGLEAEVEFVPFSFANGYDPKHPEVLRVNPKAQVPLLFDAEVTLFDSTLINDYLEDRHPNPALWPADPAARPAARLWELKSDEVLFPLNVAIRGRMATPELVSAEQSEEARRRVRIFLAELDAALEGKEYIAGAFSFADIALFFSSYFSTLLGAKTQELAHFTAWRLRVAQRGSVAPILSRLNSFLQKEGLPAPSFQ